MAWGRSERWGRRRFGHLNTAKTCRAAALASVRSFFKAATVCPKPLRPHRHCPHRPHATPAGFHVCPNPLRPHPHRPHRPRHRHPTTHTVFSASPTLPRSPFQTLSVSTAVSALPTHSTSSPPYCPHRSSAIVLTWPGSGGGGGGGLGTLEALKKLLKHLRGRWGGGVGAVVRAGGGGRGGGGGGGGLGTHWKPKTLARAVRVVGSVGGVGA